MSSQATYNPGLAGGTMRVRFNSGGSSGTGNTYEYSGIDPVTFADFIAGRLSSSGTATWGFLSSLGGRRVG
jgi:hypothetical protein